MSVALCSMVQVPKNMHCPVFIGDWLHLLFER